MLAGRRILVTGVLNRDSIAFASARRVQELGGEAVLTGFGRTLRMTERAARQLPERAEVLKLDVNSAEDLEALAAELSKRWGWLDGILHAIAYAPADALGESFLRTPVASAQSAFQASAFSLKALTAALLELLCAAPDGAAVVGLDFDASRAWPGYDWMGVAKAALESVGRYLARDLGGRGIRVNLVAAGPLETLAARSLPGFARLTELWSQTAPLGWDATDPAPVADAVCSLLSPLARMMTGEIIHVDGGYHAMGCPLPSRYRPADA
jgi:enoyl ACP reductase